MRNNIVYRFMKKVQAFIKRFLHKINRFLYRKREFVVIADNCFGGVIYQELEVPYTSPFIGLSVHASDYVRLLSNIDYYMDLPLKFISTEKNYPVGILDDVTLYFIHYKNEEEAIEKWERRKRRMLKIDRRHWYIEMDDRQQCKKQDLVNFHQLPYKNKLSFSIYELPYSNHICMKEKDNKNNSVVQGVLLYKYAYKYVDVLNFINTGKVKNTLYGRLKSKVIEKFIY